MAINRCHVIALMWRLVSWSVSSLIIRTLGLQTSLLYIFNKVKDVWKILGKFKAKLAVAAQKVIFQVERRNNLPLINQQQTFWIVWILPLFSVSCLYGQPRNVKIIFSGEDLEDLRIILKINTLVHQKSLHLRPCSCPLGHLTCSWKRNKYNAQELR